MSLSLRSWAVVSLVSALSVVVLTPGCSRQGEGERCDVVNGDTDCDDGLKCTAKINLVEGQTDRCCDPDGTSFSDSRCQPGSGSGGSGGSGGNMPTAGSATGEGGDGAPGPGGSGGSGGFPAIPDDSAGAGGVPLSAAGMPNMSEGGNPNGGVPAGGQGGAD